MKMLAMKFFISSVKNRAVNVFPDCRASERNARHLRLAPSVIELAARRQLKSWAVVDEAANSLAQGYCIHKFS